MRRIVFVKDYDVEGILPRGKQVDPIMVIPCGLAVPKGTHGVVMEGSDALYPDVLLDMGLIIRAIPEEYLEPAPLDEKVV